MLPARTYCANEKLKPSGPMKRKLFINAFDIKHMKCIVYDRVLSVLAKKSRLSPGFVEVKKAIFQVILRTIFAPKGRCQRCAKITGVKNLEKFVSI